MPRLRPIAALRERIPPFLRGVARLEPRERSALALALLSFLLFAARRYRGWL